MRTSPKLQSLQEKAIYDDLENPKYEDGHRIWNGVALGFHLPLNQARTSMNPDLMEMARRCYGYGRWDAPFWFIGLEEGMGPNETIQQRCDAWLRLECDGLSDCREFHMNIGDGRLHREAPPPRLVPTWRPLMLLLLTLLNRPADKESLRVYQRCRWGRRDGETCVIELSGLPAHGLKAAGDRAFFRRERIEDIRAKIREHMPELVVMYGRNARKHWNEIAGYSIRDDEPVEIGSTIMVSAIHPAAHNPEGDAYWQKLAAKLRNRCSTKLADMSGSR